MTQADRREIRFGPFRLDAANALLLRDGRPVALTPKSLGVLHHLASRPGELVTKEALVEHVWRDPFVSDASIKVCVREVRKALGDDATTPTYVETVHRRGYRFIAPTTGPALGPDVSAVGAVAGAAPATPPVARTASRRTLVGRERQLAALLAALDRAAAGERQVIFVAGEPGTGKTALADEAADRALAGGPGRAGAAVLVGHCFERYGTSEPYLAVWEALGQFLRTAAVPSETSRALSALMARHAAAAYAPDAGAAAASGGDAPVATAATLPRAMPERMLRDVADALESIAAAPGTLTLLLLEDVHWADYSTIDLLSALARRRSPARLMVLATYRPSEAEADGHPLRDVVPALVAGRLAHEISLGPLDEPAVARYLADRFGGAPVPAGLARLLRQRTGGHPLFLTHLVDDLVQHGPPDAAAGPADGGRATAAGDDVLLRVPATVRAVIETQLDRLEPDERRVLEAAAVAGVEFSAAAAAAAVEGDVVAVEAACEALADRHRFVERTGADDWPDGTLSTRYRFAHELYHSVVYAAVPVARRARMHAAVAGRLEAAWGARAAEAAAALSIHFEHARNWAATVRYLHTAADAAVRQYAHREAVDYLRRALAAHDHLPVDQRGRDRELALLMSLGVNLQVTRGFAAPEVGDVHARAHALCRTPDADPRSTFRVLWGVFVFHKVRSDLAKAMVMAHELLALAEAAGDVVMKLEAHQAFCVTGLCLGDFPLVARHAAAADALYDVRHHTGATQLFGQDPGVATQAFASVAHVLAGGVRSSLADAARAHERSVALARKLDQPSTLVLATQFAAVYHQCLGDASAAGRYARETVELSAAEGFSFWHAGGTVLLGWSRAAQGDPSGVDDIRRGIDAWLATGSRTYHSHYLGLLADALLRTGRTDEARAVVREAIGVAAELSEGMYLKELKTLAARL